MNRLSIARLAEAGVAALPYDRSVPPTIVHLGVGAFARAHLGVYADDLLRNGRPATIAGVSLRDPRTEALLVPQDGLYTVTEREPGAAPAPRVIGSFTTVGTGPDHAVALIGEHAPSLVTLTVTEKGYEVPAADLADPGGARSAAGVLARALGAVRRSGARPPAIASLDNLADNGTVLRGAVHLVAERIDHRLPAWIDRHVEFPSSVVDRMVPASTDADRTEVAAVLGLLDEAAVVAEHHRSWAIQSVDGLPPFEDVGVEVVASVAAHQRRKLWLLNAPHSALAYAGLLAGVTTIADALAHPIAGPFGRAVSNDILAVVDLPPAMEAPEFAAESLARFANRALGHTCTQVGADGSRKLTQRIFPVAEARAAAGLPNRRLAMVTAIWLAAVAHRPVAGVTLPAVDDPISAVLAGTTDDDLVAVAIGHGAAVSFAAEVRSALDRLAGDGIATLVECL
ncbi:MAG TPA: mannitol dehydrogenase family protein [Microthrixaceae bacterium]|nr:mannitol dehydrogenase family protein [Microthrixaceae bacterium]